MYFALQSKIPYLIYRDWGVDIEDKTVLNLEKLSLYFEKIPGHVFGPYHGKVSDI